MVPVSQGWKRWVEAVGVPHGGESAADHFVREGVRAIHGGDAHGEVLSDAEVAGSPGDGFAEFDEPGGAPGDGLLVRSVGAGQVGVDAAGKVEDSLLWSVDFCFEFDEWHGSGERYSNEAPSIWVGRKVDSCAEPAEGGKCGGRCQGGRAGAGGSARSTNRGPWAQGG